MRLCLRHFSMGRFRAVALGVADPFWVAFEAFFPEGLGGMAFV